MTESRTAPDAARARRTSWRAKLVLLALSVGLSFALVFALGELAFRMSFGTARSYRLAEIVRAHPVRGWQLRPGKYDYFNPAAFSRASFAITKPGIRGTGVAARATAGRKRVSIAGDSFVFSEALSDGETAADQLSLLLGKSHEVLNLGVPGYGTGQELLWLDELHASGFELGETLVLAFFTNDIADNVAMQYGSMERDPHQPFFSIEGGRVVHSQPEPFPHVPDDASRGLFEDSLFKTFLARRAEVLAARTSVIVNLLGSVGYKVQLPRTPGIIPAWYGEDWQSRWTLTQELLRHVAQRARDWGVRDFRVIFVPSPFQVEEVFLKIARQQRGSADYDTFLADVDRPQRLLLRFCAEAGLTCHDLTPTLRNTGGESAFFLREGHLNAHGSKLFAKALAGWLRAHPGAQRAETAH